MPISWSRSRWSQGSDCQIRRFSEPSSCKRWNTRSAPSQPSLSWTATTPRDKASGIASREAVDHLVLRRAHVGVAEVPGALLAEDAGRLAVRVPLDDAAGNLEVGVGQRECRGVDPERVVVLGHQRHRHVAGDSVECLLRRLDRRRPLAVPPAEPAQPPALGHLADRRCHTRERVVERLGALEPHLALCQRPAREVHVGVGEARQDAPPAEVDPLRAREGGLVRPDAAGDPVARDRERRGPRQRGIERADDAVLEDHAGDDSAWNVPTPRRTAGCPSGRRSGAGLL